MGLLKLADKYSVDRLEAAEKRIAELSAIFKRLYEDSVTGRISDERFTELSADYEAEQRELKERAAAIQAELSKAQEATVNAEKFMNVVRRHTSFEELTPTLLREFVEKIVVHECSYDAVSYTHLKDGNHNMQNKLNFVWRMRPIEKVY